MHTVPQRVCVSLPEPQLQFLLKEHPDWTGFPVAVVKEDKPQSFLLSVNEKARAAGILPGHRYAAALSLSSSLRAAPIDSSDLNQSLKKITTELRTICREIDSSPDEPSIFWLNYSGLKRLFPSLKAWTGRIHRIIASHGYHSILISGFSKFNTYAIAKSFGKSKQPPLFIDNLALEKELAGKVPLERLNLDPKLRDSLNKLGITTLSQFLSLPPKGLFERFGKEAYDFFLRADGEIPADSESVPDTAELKRTYILESAETDTTRLLFLIKYLLDSLLFDLQKNHLVLDELLISMDLEGNSTPTDLCIKPAFGTRESVLLMDLVRLRLESTTLKSGITGVKLSARSSDLLYEQSALFSDQPTRDLRSGQRALARIRAEFGEHSVVHPKLIDGHLPEACFEWQPTDEVRWGTPRKDQPESLIRRLYTKPQPLTNLVKVELMAGPYIVSGGWWNRTNGSVHRKYYFARSRQNELLWIYFDSPRHRWFIHGHVE